MKRIFVSISCYIIDFLYYLLAVVSIKVSIKKTYYCMLKREKIQRKKSFNTPLNGNGYFTPLYKYIYLNIPWQIIVGYFCFVFQCQSISPAN